MGKNTSFSLGEHFDTFIDAQVSQGRFGSSSEVVRAGLRLLEEREVRIAALQNALIDGEQSGAPGPFDFEAFIHRRRGRKSSAK